jgi:hypothetical protein
MAIRDVSINNIAKDESIMVIFTDERNGPVFNFVVN